MLPEPVHTLSFPSAMTGWNPNGQHLVPWPEDFLSDLSTRLATGAAGHGTQERRPLEQPPNRAGTGWCMSTLAPRSHRDTYTTAAGTRGGHRAEETRPPLGQGT